jgi:hypothetical protein
VGGKNTPALRGLIRFVPLQLCPQFANGSSPFPVFFPFACGPIREWYVYQFVHLLLKQLGHLVGNCNYISLAAAWSILLYLGFTHWFHPFTPDSLRKISKVALRGHQPLLSSRVL